MVGTVSNLSPLRVGAPAGSYMLHLLREHYLADCTIGKLFVDGQWLWYTRENPRVVGSTAPTLGLIPAGAYPVVLAYSAYVGRVLPVVQQVPGHIAGVRIQPANAKRERIGAIGIGGGYDRRHGQLVHTRVAADRLTDALRAAGQVGRQVWIEIYDAAGGGE